MPLGRGFCKGRELPSGRTVRKGYRGPDVRPSAVLSRRTACRRARDAAFPASPASILIGMALGTLLAMGCALVAGANAIGMIFYPPSPRSITVGVIPNSE